MVYVDEVAKRGDVPRYDHEEVSTADAVLLDLHVHFPATSTDACVVAAFCKHAPATYCKKQQPKLPVDQQELA
jgi:hypothetical protein